MNQATRAATMLAAVITTTTAYATDYYWQGGAGTFNSPNYTSVDNTTSPATLTPGVSPSTALTDYIFIGGGTDAAPSSVTSSASFTTGHIRIGTASTAAQPTAQPGTGSITNTAGTLKAGGGSATGGTSDTSLIVGYDSPGSLTISGGTVSASFYGKIGYSDTPSATGAGTVTLSAGTFAITNRGLQIGEGLPGSLTMTGGSLTISNSTTGQLAIGTTSTGTFTQSAGTTTTGNNLFVGRTTSSSSSMSVTGGSVTANGIFYVGDGSATDSSATWAGSMVGTVTGSIDVGNGTTNRSSLTISGSANVFTGGAINLVSITGASNSSLTVNGNSTLSVVGNLQAGANADPNAVFNVGDNATINIGVAANSSTAPSITSYLFVGRSTATTTFNMTGGTINAPNYALFGTASAGAVVTINHSAGTINSGTSATSPNRGFKIGDTNGLITYNLSNTGTINSVNGPFIVGRQGAVATLNQTGGTLVATGGLNVGFAETPTASFQTGTGTYVLSGGSATASLPTGSTAPAALTVGNEGTGTLRVVGSAGTLNVTGDALIDAIPGRSGVLAYQLKPADPSLSTINATGNATFSAGAILNLDFNGSIPTRGLYNLLAAATVVNNGLTFSAPAGWGYNISNAGAGQMLRAFAGDFNSDGRINADDYAIMDRGAAKNLTDGADGDLNADGSINASDYLLIDSANAQLNGPLSPSFLATRESEFGDAYVTTLLANVPEPTSLLAACALPLLRRKRRSL
jgi:hypothetical protein